MPRLRTSSAASLPSRQTSTPLPVPSPTASGSRTTSIQRRRNYGSLARRGLEPEWTATERPIYATPMDLNAVRDFLVVAEHGSYAEAGRVLGFAQVKLSRRVAALERSLGVRLMHRNSRHLRLTAEGEELQERAASLVSALSDLEE